MSDIISAEPVAGVAFESVVPVEKPLQTDLSVLPELLEVDLLVRAAEARAEFNVDGSGMTVAVLDTRLRTTRREVGTDRSRHRPFEEVGRNSSSETNSPDVFLRSRGIRPDGRRGTAGGSKCLLISGNVKPPADFGQRPEAVCQW
ncbi:hypothetical protein ACFVAV_27500 [Nocardia sp. NPDC057663]|uniref:hypothetical protein n=1 Tax=Nocardia sp. NPDC057663 TaxID=3346201 RepID=UPI0036732701